MRNPDGTFKTGDSETREAARKGGEASGGSRAQRGQRNEKSPQHTQSTPGDDNSHSNGDQSHVRNGRAHDTHNMRSRIDEDNDK